MTDLLNAEDIKKAVGAFTGEQRAPLPRPLPVSTTPAPGTPRGPAAGRCSGALLCPRILLGDGST